jgi:hypothetical protein
MFWAVSLTANAQHKPNILVIWGDVVGQFLSTFKEFPPRQEPASFSIDQVMEKLQIGSGSK